MRQKIYTQRERERDLTATSPYMDINGSELFFQNITECNNMQTMEKPIFP